jgi:hypothetical protein
MFTVITVPSVLPVLGLALPTVHLSKSSEWFKAVPISIRQFMAGRCAGGGQVVAGVQWASVASINLHWRGQA